MQKVFLITILLFNVSCCLIFGSKDKPSEEKYITQKSDTLREDITSIQKHLNRLVSMKNFHIQESFTPEFDELHKKLNELISLQKNPLLIFSNQQISSSLDETKDAINSNQREQIRSSWNETNTKIINYLQSLE